MQPDKSLSKEDGTPFFVKYSLQSPVSGAGLETRK